MNCALLEKINSTCGGGIGYGLPPQELISTGLPALDAVIGGIPKGRIVDINGSESSGKTALALHLARQLPGPMLYIDADHGLSPHILNGTDGYLLDVPTMEDAMDACKTAAESGGFGSIVIDTVAALPTKVDAQNSLTNGRFWEREVQARVMSKALPILAGAAYKTGCTMILVNQIREKHGVVFGDPEYPTGGKAIGYYAALRLRTFLTGRIKKTNLEIGRNLSVMVRKCKYGPPGRQVELKLLYGVGFESGNNTPPPRKERRR